VNLVDIPLRPPTDNLYKFLALSGLAVSAFFGWKYLQVELERIKLDNDVTALLSDLKSEVVKIGEQIFDPSKPSIETEANSRFDIVADKDSGRVAWLKEVPRQLMAQAIEARFKDKPKENAEAQRRLLELFDKDPKFNSRLHDLVETGDKQRLVPKKDDPHQITLAAISGAGLFFAVVGFWLWWRKVQCPLDKIMEFDLAERQAKARATSA
jgi:hypothetical protein